jgi:hypothetical protein
MWGEYSMRLRCGKALEQFRADRGFFHHLLVPLERDCARPPLASPKAIAGRARGIPHRGAGQAAGTEIFVFFRLPGPVFVRDTSPDKDDGKRKPLTLRGWCSSEAKG